MGWYANLTIAYGCLALASMAAFVTLLWWDVRRYPMCRSCGSNGYVLRAAEGPRCSIHGTVATAGGRP